MPKFVNIEAFPAVFCTANDWAAQRECHFFEASEQRANKCTHFVDMSCGLHANLPLCKNTKVLACIVESAMAGILKNNGKATDTQDSNFLEIMLTAFESRLR